MLRSIRCKSRQQASNGQVANESTWTSAEELYLALSGRGRGEAALKRAGGRIYGPNGAGELLGVKPTTLQSRLRALGIRAEGEGS
jgi:transcriptional regulator with GAF, ATPase, and Fis domain